MTKLKLGKGMKVFPLPSIQIALHKQFVPQVQEQLSGPVASDWGTTFKFELKFVEHMQQVDGMRYALTVEIEKPVAVLHLIEIAKQLDTYCVNQDAPFAAGDGRNYTLGDGDDSGAVMFEDGVFSIWLRGWPKDE